MHYIHRSTGGDTTTASVNYCGPKENEGVACFDYFEGFFQPHSQAFSLSLHRVG